MGYAVSIVATGFALAGPAGAQFSGGRSAFDERVRPESVQFRDFFRNPFWGDRGGYPNNSYDPYNPFNQRPQVYEPIKPPAPRKVETPPAATVVVIGDSLAEWLGYGLEQAFADTPEIGIARRIKPSSGLVRYEARPDAPEWSQAVKDLLAADKPSAIVVMLGLNDRLPLRDRVPSRPGAAAPASGQVAVAPSAPAAAPAEPPPPDLEQPAAASGDAQRRPPGALNEFHTDKWAELYSKRIDEMIAALKTKGVPIVWVGLPAIRGAKSTSDMSYLDELYRARADKAGITYVDIWDGFVDEQGRYVVQGPDFEGQTRRLRTYDGVHFTKAGAEKLAHYVEHDLRPLLNNHVVPVALPGPEEPLPAKGNAVGARPAIGPIVPLGALGGGEGGDLLGASGHPASRDSDPVVTRVLSRGDAITAPPGRADNFSWPRADADAGANGAADASPAPTAPVPTASKGGSGEGETKKSDANKTGANRGDGDKIDPKKPSDAKNQPVPPPAPPGVAPAKPHRTRIELDGAPPRPPLPVGPAASTIR